MSGQNMIHPSIDCPMNIYVQYTSLVMDGSADAIEPAWWWAQYYLQNIGIILQE